MKTVHLLYTPFTGLGLYGGHRGNRWLRNRIQIFKQFVIPSICAQTNRDFILWVSWRPEDRGNAMIEELADWLERHTDLKFFFTYSGVCFWDDKYDDARAQDRLAAALHGATPILHNNVGEADKILMTIQPSDDCYEESSMQRVREEFDRDTSRQAVGFQKGYVADYAALNIAEWNPRTSPPFYTIKFDRETFLNPKQHIDYAGIKSHEELPQRLSTAYLNGRGYMVGTHGENISTIFNHPFRGPDAPRAVLKRFGLADVQPLKLPISLRKKLMRRLPHWWQRKIRYIFGERFAAKIYDFLRS
jgi:hypothetical protein